MRCLFLLTALIVLFLGGAAQACASPNPNLLAPPFVDGCDVPAIALNRLIPFNNSCISIIASGGNGGGLVANDTAFATAISSGISGKPCVYFPTGTYKFFNPLTITLASAGNVATLYGDGPDASTLLFASTNGITINETNQATSVHIHDLAIAPSVSGGTGITEASTVHINNMASSTYFHLKIGDPINGNFYATGIQLSGRSQENLDGLDIWNGSGSLDPGASGTRGIDLENTAANLGFIFYIANTNIYGAQYGLYYGPGVQGVTINAANFTLNHFGIYVSTAASSAAQAMLNVVNSQFDNYNDNILADTGNQLSHGMFSNNLFYVVGGTNGIHLLAGGDYQVVHNNFSAVAPFTLETATSAVLATTPLGVNIIDGNECILITPCVSLTSTAANWRIFRNQIDGAAGETNVANASAGGNNLVVGNNGTGLFGPQANTITAAANNGSGLVRVTLGSAMTTATAFVNDQVLLFVIPGVISPGLFKINVIDTTHLDLLGSVFGGSLTSNGVVSAEQ